MRPTLTFFHAGLIALAALAGQACFEETYSPPAYYGDGPSYYSSRPEYAPYYAGRPVVRNYYYGGSGTAENHSDDRFHRDAGGRWRNSEGETPRQERREQNRESWIGNH
jgi:hypothetical protein